MVCCRLLSLAQAPPQDLAQWQLVCYCSGSADPVEIIRYDNNGRILYLARDGVTRERLKQYGVAFIESQIELMKDWRLLTERQGKLNTSIPVLGPEQMTHLRSLLQVPATETARSLRPSFEQLVSLLRSHGYADSAYSIVFSYLLDGMVWGDFDQRHLLPPMEATAEKPFWAGALWAVYPKQNVPGTNSMWGGAWRLKVMWQESVQPVLDPLNDSSLVNRALDELGSSGTVSDPKARSQLVALGILDSDGEPLAPVIREVPSDPIYAASLALSSKISDAMLRTLHSPELQGGVDVKNEQVLLIIAYHEFMWELLAQLQSEGLVSPPSIFSASSVDPKQVRSLVFFAVSAPN